MTTTNGRGERLAVSVVFALNGFVIGNWVARIPAAADAVGASPAVLGAVLLAIAGGAAVSMPIIGRLCTRWASRSVTRVAAVLHPLALPLPALAHSPATLAIALAGYGVTSGALDVSMNANAVAVIRRARRPLMPSFHGMWSVGGMAGSATGGLAASAGLGLGPHFGLAAAVGVVVGAVAGRFLGLDPPSAAGPAPEATSGEVLPAPTEAPREAVPPRLETPGAAVPRRPTTRPGTRGGVRLTVGRAVRAGLRRTGVDGLLAVLGAVAFCSALGEGAMADWSALYLRNVTGAGTGTAAAGYAAFSVAMAAARFGGGPLIRRFDAARVLTGGCLLAAAGIAVAVAVPIAGTAVAGFTAVGLGLSCAFPVVMNAAGAHAAGSGPAIGIVATVGYGGFLAGAPLIGVLASRLGLRWALGVVGVAALVGAAVAARRRDDLRRHDPSREQPVPA